MKKYTQEEVNKLLSQALTEQHEADVQSFREKIEGKKKKHKGGFHICFSEHDIFVDSDTGKKVCAHKAMIEIHNEALDDLLASLDEIENI